MCYSFHKKKLYFDLTIFIFISLARKKADFNSIKFEVDSLLHSPPGKVLFLRPLQNSAIVIITTEIKPTLYPQNFASNRFGKEILFPQSPPPSHFQHYYIHLNHAVKNRVKKVYAKKKVMYIHFLS